MLYIRLIIITLALIIPINASSLEISEQKLGNGLKVLVIEDRKAPVATFQIWYRTGSRNDPSGKTGLSHLLEHMMYKGTVKYSTQMFSRIVQTNGGTDNAYTTGDYTVYHEVFPSDEIILSIDLEADRMQNLILDPEEVASEKNVVIEERRLEHEDDPYISLFEEVVALAFKVHPYKKPVIGWISDVPSIEREDLYDFYKTYYTPDNAFIIVTGDVKTDEIVASIRETFGKIPSGPSKKTQISSEPEQRGERRVLLKREVELPYILIAYHTPNYSDKDCNALMVLDMLLSGGESSRLIHLITYEKQLALDVGSEYVWFNMDPYLFFIEATVSPGKEIKEVEDTIYAEIERIKIEPPSEKEIQKAKNQIEASFIIDQDSIEIQAEKYGIFEILGDWRLAERYLDGIRNVTPEDVVTVARKYMHEDNRTVGILIPVKSR